MEIAEQIQTSLCPPVPTHPQFTMAASMSPAEEVGGDYYDMLIDSDNNLWIAIGDVSGHGVTPGLIMMMAETAFNSYVMEMGPEATPKDAMISVNRTLTDNIRDRLNEKHFMTMNFLKYMGKGKFLHAGAHVDIIVYRNKTQTCDIYPTDGMYLGIIPDITKQTKNNSFIVNKDDILVVYTDGVIESKHKDDKEHLMGIEVLEDTIIKNGDKDVDTIMNTIRIKALEWCGHAPEDDITVVVIKRMK
jgi:serine phosphatase RsbU (regulator of sigma subunit)